LLRNIMARGLSARTSRLIQLFVSTRTAADRTLQYQLTVPSSKIQGIQQIEDAMLTQNSLADTYTSRRSCPDTR
jgi:hypothetical protein